ncbi:Hypothetical protein A7982_02035 [Minicystis rosea]|nr:Hypothetical protein A7982_02035 [Minicystis rosea]
MKSWALCTFIVSAVALTACGSSTDGTGGNGGSVGTGSGGATTGTGTTGTGNNGTTGTGNNTTTGTGNNTTTGTGTGGSAGSCDNKGVCQDADQDTTNDCFTCALFGACTDQYNACKGDQDCIALNTCFNGCGQNDSTCLSGCAQQHPTGYQLYQALVTCAVCQECPVDCDGPGQGCPAN